MTPLLSSALLRAQSDERLVALAATGHDRAFEAIVERYRRPLLRYLRRLLSDTLAEDVVQATFINAWSSLRTGNEVRDLRPWLYRIAHNAAINALKKVGEAMEEVPESIGGFATEPAAELERRDEIQRALTSIAALPSRQRAALLAVAVDGRAHSEVAQELGLTDGAVRQLVHRARTTLRHGATALTPMPLIHAMVASAGDSTVARVAEVAAGAGGAGAASLSLKAGAAAVLATGALATGGPKVAHVVTPSHPATEAAAVHRATKHRASTTARRRAPAGGATTGARTTASRPAATASASASSGEHRRAAGKVSRRNSDSGGGGASKKHDATPAAGEDRSGPNRGPSVATTGGNSGSGSESSGRGGDGESQSGRRSGRNETSGKGRHKGKGKGTTDGKGKGEGSGAAGPDHDGASGGDDNLVVSPPSAPEPSDGGGGDGDATTPAQGVPTTTQPTTPPPTTTTTPPPTTPTTPTVPPESPGSVSTLPGGGG